jgi:hypothetical protein
MFRGLSLLLDDPTMRVHFSHDLGWSDAMRVAKFANNSGIYSRILGQGGKQPPPHIGIRLMRVHNPVLLWQCSCARHRTLASATPIFVDGWRSIFHQAELLCELSHQVSGKIRPGTAFPPTLCPFVGVKVPGAG